MNIDIENGDVTENKFFWSILSCGLETFTKKGIAKTTKEIKMISPKGESKIISLKEFSNYNDLLKAIYKAYNEGFTTMISAQGYEKLNYDDYNKDIDYPEIEGY